MDILRKELNGIYESQRPGTEIPDEMEIGRCKTLAENFVAIFNGCAVITDAWADHSFLSIGTLGKLIGVADEPPLSQEVDSSDEDVIYMRMHPEDLVEKRMLEYEFFKFVDPMERKEKLQYQATCRIRFKSKDGGYVVIDNSTQIIAPSPSGKIWLILCTYVLSSDQLWHGSISPAIKNNQSGEIIELTFNERRKHILSEREKEVLMLVKQGKASKQIADILDISLHTVNRHRQNILEKLSVDNSIEAVMAAEAMKLL